MAGSSATYQDAVIWGKGHALYAGVLAVPAADYIVHHLASFNLIYIPATQWSKWSERHTAPAMWASSCQSRMAWATQKCGCMHNLPDGGLPTVSSS